MYSEVMLRDALSGVNEGIRVGAVISLRQCALRMIKQPQPVQLKVCNL